MALSPHDVLTLTPETVKQAFQKWLDDTMSYGNRGKLLVTEITSLATGAMQIQVDAAPAEEVTP